MAMQTINERTMFTITEDMVGREMLTITEDMVGGEIVFRSKTSEDQGVQPTPANELQEIMHYRGADALAKDASWAKTFAEKMGQPGSFHPRNERDRVAIPDGGFPNEPSTCLLRLPSTYTGSISDDGKLQWDHQPKGTNDKHSHISLEWFRGDGNLMAKKNGEFFLAGCNYAIEFEMEFLALPSTWANLWQAYGIGADNERRQQMALFYHSGVFRFECRDDQSNIWLTPESVRPEARTNVPMRFRFEFSVAGTSDYALAWYSRGLSPWSLLFAHNGPIGGDKPMSPPDGQLWNGFGLYSATACSATFDNITYWMNDDPQHIEFDELKEKV